MKFVIQRVSSAKVEIAGKVKGSIDKGFLVLIGVGAEDFVPELPKGEPAQSGLVKVESPQEKPLDISHAKEIADRMVKKLVNMRIFDDAEGKTNVDLNSVDGNLLLISQFTLFADCKKGNRPSFINAGAPGPSEEIYEYIVERCREELGMDRVETGEFGADMHVSLVNEGPFTVVLDSREL